MKKIFIGLIFLVSIVKSYGQINLVDDEFIFSDTSLNYKINPTYNDSIPGAYSIFLFSKLDTNSYSISIEPDSTTFKIVSSVNGAFSGAFKYFVKFKNNTAVDSATIYFTKKALLNDVFPGDANNDNLVNHLDILPLGLMYKTYGSPRSLHDTSTTFTPKQAGDWKKIKGNINAKYSDINGDGIVDSIDFSALQRTYGAQKGVYTPKLSPTSSQTFLQATNSLGVNNSDTFIYDSNKPTTIKIPISVVSPNNINAYGIGYSYKLTYGDSLNNSYSNHVFKPEPNWVNPSNALKAIRYDGINRGDVAFSKIDTMNSSGKGQMGVIEIVVVDVLIGIINPGDISKFRLELFEVAFIDKDYNMIPITPTRYDFYIKNKECNGLSVNIEKMIDASELNDVTLFARVAPLSSNIVFKWNNGKTSNTNTNISSGNYWVYVVDTVTKCSDTAYYTLVDSVYSSIQNKFTSQILVYPTSLKDILTIENPMFLNLDIHIYDILGRTIYTQVNKKDKLYINTEAWNKGWYIVRINDYSTKVFKE